MLVRSGLGDGSGYFAEDCPSGTVAFNDGCYRQSGPVPQDVLDEAQRILDSQGIQTTCVNETVSGGPFTYNNPICRLPGSSEGLDPLLVARNPNFGIMDAAMIDSASQLPTPTFVAQNINPGNPVGGTSSYSDNVRQSNNPQVVATVPTGSGNPSQSVGNGSQTLPRMIENITTGQMFTDPLGWLKENWLLAVGVGVGAYLLTQRNRF